MSRKARGCGRRWTTGRDELLCLTAEVVILGNVLLSVETAIGTRACATRAASDVEFATHTVVFGTTFATIAAFCMDIAAAFCGGGGDSDLWLEGAWVAGENCLTGLAHEGGGLMGVLTVFAGAVFGAEGGVCKTRTVEL